MNSPQDSAPGPFWSGPMEIESAWIDYNGHLNMGYYTVLFDRGADQAYGLLGLGPDYAERRGLTTYTAEYHVRYIRELQRGDMVRASFQMIGHDAKRFHAWQELWHEDGWLAATGEGVSLHVDMTGPRVVPMPDDILARVAAMQQAHAALPRPEGLGRKITLQRQG